MNFEAQVLSGKRSSIFQFEKRQAYFEQYNRVKSKHQFIQDPLEDYKVIPR